MASQRDTLEGTQDSSTPKLSDTAPATTKDTTPRVNGDNSPVRTPSLMLNETENGKAICESTYDKCLKPNVEEKRTQVEIGSTSSSDKDSDFDTDSSDVEAILSKLQEEDRIDAETIMSSEAEHLNEQAWAKLDLQSAAPWWLAQNFYNHTQLQSEFLPIALYQNTTMLSTTMPDKKWGTYRYQLHSEIFEELATMTVASLRSNLQAEARIIIRCPADNGQLFLEAVVKLLAQRLGALLICFDAQDMADLKDIQQVSHCANKMESLPYVSYTSQRDRVTLSTGQTFWVTGFGRSDHLQKLFLAMFDCIEKPSIERDKPPKATSNSALDHADNDNSDTTEKASLSPLKEAQRVIFYVRDFRAIVSTKTGRDVMYSLNKAIIQRRQAGHPVVWIAGDCSSKRFYGSLDAGACWLDESQVVDVTPPGSAIQRAVLTADQPRWNLENNIRSLKRMLRDRSSHEGSPVEPLAEWQAEWNLKDKDKYRRLITSLEASIWPSEVIAATVKCICGQTPKASPVTEADIAKAILTRDISRAENQEHARRYIATEDFPKPPDMEDPDDTIDLDEIIDDVLGPIDDENAYLQCVKEGLVKPGKFNVHFNDIFVAPKIKEAVQRLVKLSIQQQREFAYGILKNHRVPGILLYGPPGTGKTMMAKAVATESHCVTMEISGAQILQSKVGQSEKIIEVVFHVARRLAQRHPCIVLLDEADSVLVRRTEKTNSWERSTVNQFLHEWDKLVSTKERTFVIVSTNRPQDIDEAILRRLPQRLHIGLPGQEERLAILNHYLKCENKDNEVNLEDLVTKTESYSGSDLKNICVYAALHASEEQMLKPSVTPPGLPKPKRILRKEHFEMAMGDARPCVSNIMLSDIHRFETMYGADIVQKGSLRRLARAKQIGLKFQRWISAART
ncbi:ATPase family AAA domain-containing protein 1-A [Fusarium oxysporum f. sp. rapae]|uniref:ATPase family AAA domain-containing protein 1-A n=1 Tax=Fusarium oxysporum f. sp. rapae TaxID=485398 RepID=A0A8J5NKS6_FUSOX|nr:ATPase family AAA domain-containing protein 1-A [Fusarium oxysporum f. sp. rapae]